MSKQNEYFPDEVTHPGETLSERLEELNIGSKEFAIKTGKPEKTISQVLKGASAITPDMAVLFEKVLDIPASFWLERQNKYDIAIARVKREKALVADLEWVKNFPYANMAKLGWVKTCRKSADKLENILAYFGVSNASGFTAFYMEQKVPVSFRISLSKTKKPFAFAAWLRQGELQANKFDTALYDKAKLKAALPKLKAIMAAHPDNFFQQIQDVCLSAGVKVVYTPCLSGAAVHGSTRWVGDVPLIQLSARYKQNDIFWFTFFHEIAHILKHGKKYVALEKVDYDEEEQIKEQEADDFAVEWTFSKKEEAEVLSNEVLYVEDIVKYAEKFGTHPAMIIGRFHHKKLLHYSVGREFIKPIDLTNYE